MSVPKVSVLIPCCNAGRYIGETLDSVFRQTWENLEVIVVDDGSTDDSAEVIGRFTGPRMTFIRQENRGQTAALNVAAARAAGDYVQYIDADDIIGPEKIESQMKRIAGSQRAVASAAWGRFHSGIDEAIFTPEPVWQDLDPVDWLAKSRENGLGMMFPALWLIPISIVRSAGPWREDLTLNNDAEYFTRVLLASGEVLFCGAAKCYYRSGLPGSLSGRKTRAAFVSQVKVNELCESHVRAREDSARVRRGFALTWQHLAHACYPYAPDIAEDALRRARVLHEVSIVPSGGRTFKLVSSLIGWRMARRLQVLSGRN